MKVSICVLTTRYRLSLDDHLAFMLLLSVFDECLIVYPHSSNSDRLPGLLRSTLVYFVYLVYTGLRSPPPDASESAHPVRSACATPNFVKSSCLDKMRRACSVLSVLWGWVKTKKTIGVCLLTRTFDRYLFTIACNTWSIRHNSSITASA